MIPTRGQPRWSQTVGDELESDLRSALGTTRRIACSQCRRAATWIYSPGFRFYCDDCYVFCPCDFCTVEMGWETCAEYERSETGFWMHDGGFWPDDPERAQQRR